MELIIVLPVFAIVYLLYKQMKDKHIAAETLKALKEIGFSESEAARIVSTHKKAVRKMYFDDLDFTQIASRLAAGYAERAGTSPKAASTLE